MKNVIYNRKTRLTTDFIITHYSILFTVCRSLLNNISVKNPEPIPKGAKLISANILPIISPEKRLS